MKVVLLLAGFLTGNGCFSCRDRRLFRERDPRRPFKSILTPREPTEWRVKSFLKNEGHIVSFQEK